jgi:hypothetical protein
MQDSKTSKVGPWWTFYGLKDQEVIPTFHQGPTLGVFSFVLEPHGIDDNADNAVTSRC